MLYYYTLFIMMEGAFFIDIFISYDTLIYENLLEIRRGLRGNFEKK